MNPSGDSDDSPQAGGASGVGAARSPKGRRQEIVEGLLADVLGGRLAPGKRLITEELARRFSVSHTPIREALSTLAGIGVVELRPNRGAVVRRLGPRDLIDLIHVRRVLECEAVRKACGQVSADRLDDLASQFGRLLTARDQSSRRFVDLARRLDNQLHDTIAAACGNALLVAELGRLKLLFRAVRDEAWRRVGTTLPLRLREEADEHLAIVNALRAGDRRAAQRAMSRHIRAAIQYWLPLLKSPSPQLPSPSPISPVSVSPRDAL
jgi:DNA-binding GntR family transcriptional regulator